MQVMRLSHPVVHRTLAAAGGCVLLLSACGGGGDGSSQVASLGTGAAGATTTTVSSADTQQQWLDFAQCMRDNGVDMADPTFDADGNLASGGIGPGSDIDFRSDSVRTALSSCQDLMPAGGPGGGGGPQFDRTAIQTAFNDFTSCLRDQGLEVDDIDFATGPGGGAPPGGGSAPDVNGQPPTSDGGFQGPPPSDGGGGPDGAGFDPTARIIEQLGLDATDPTVSAAVDACSATLSGALPGANGSTSTTTG
jgi:hypothetical protein